MIGLLTAVLIFCFYCMNVSKAGMLCSERQMNWKDGLYNCSFMVGKPVTIDEKNPDIFKQLNESIEVWASGSTFFEKCDNGEGLEVCAYSFIEGFPPNFNNETLYGDCNENRNTICWQNGLFMIYQADHNEATNCKINPTYEQARQLYLPPGFYWRVGNFKLCPLKYKYFSPGLLTATSLCKVYSKLYGFFFVNCGSTRYTICELEDNLAFQPEGYTGCRKDHFTSIIVPPSSYVVTETVTTSQQPSSTKLSTSDVTITRQSYVSTHKTTEYNHISDLTTSSTYSTLSYKTSTGTSDLGLKIGLPVALCVVLFGVHVVTLIVYFRRRHRNNGRDENRGEFEDDTVGAISTTNQLQTRNETTVTYEAYNNAANDNSVEHVYSSIDEGGNYEII